MIDVISSTRGSIEEFKKSPLAQSLARLADPRLVPRICYENREKWGISEVYNDQIEAESENDILLFIHDDVWIDDDAVVEKISEALSHFQVCGLAGLSVLPKEHAGWCFRNIDFEKLDCRYFSGRVTHHKASGRPPDDYGPTRQCWLLDGLFLAVRRSVLLETGVRFDRQFRKHCYDLDFCRSADAAGLTLTTWPINVTHDSSGNWGDEWKAAVALYQEKWNIHRPWASRTQIINEIIRHKGATSYLEIGYGDGGNFAAIQCEHKWSVDPADCDYPEASPTHRMTSDAFFETNTQKFDVIFIDGLHHADQVERDINNSLAALTARGVVVCHDMNPTSEEMQMVPRMQHDWTGDCWKAWVRLRVAPGDLAMVVVDADYGVGLILPGTESGPVIDPLSLTELTWTNFYKNRRQWLNLRAPEEAREFVLERLGTKSVPQAMASKEFHNVAILPQRAPVRHEGPTAIILYGVMHRSLRHVVANLREFVIKPLSMLGEVDIFFHSWDVGNITSPRSGEYGVEVRLEEVARWLPEARGIFESQEAFDATINWGPLMARNPMRNFTGGEEASRATLVNYRRALESQERAWKYFQKNKGRTYQRVVVTRPDLLFLNELPIPPRWGEPVSYGEDGEAMASRLFVPRFEAWGGVCDRFAMGAEREVGIWCQKAAFADGWLMKAGDAGHENPEWLLSKWLQRNRVELGFIDFIHQRMRANGEVTWEDRYMIDLKPVVKSRQAAAERGLLGSAVCQTGDVGAIEESGDLRIEYKIAPLVESPPPWYEVELDEWKRCFTCRQVARVMQIGVADGMGGLHLLDTLFTHTKSELHWVNTDDAREADFLNVMQENGHEKQVHIYNGTSAEILAWMIAEEGYWQSFDFIHHGGETAGELLVDACQSWHLLKPGGVMVFSRSGGKHQLPKQLAVDAFVSTFGTRIHLLLDGNTLALRKL